MDNMKKKCAVFTIVKNESYFLPIWLKHYQKYFSNEDIYVLDHQSDDGSTTGLNVNVVPIVNELAFDHQWLVDTVQNFQEQLLQQYECVLFAESDELIYSVENPLDKVIDIFLNDEEVKFQTCTGHEVIQHLDQEKPLQPGEEIFENRNYWFKFPMYDKTLLSKVPLNWVWGFHETKDLSVNTKYNLFLCHLHRVDFEFMLKRHEERATKWKLKDDGNAGHQHRIGDRKGVSDYFLSIPSRIVEIPQIHKLALNGI